MLGCWVLRGGSGVIGKRRDLSFCHVACFFISGLIFHWRASSIHLNVLFLALRKLMNSNICERVCVCVCAPLCALMPAWVYMCVCEHMRRAFLCV